MQKYFEQSLSKAEVMNDALTFHAFEIEESDGDVLDVKVLPNRATDCLCHRGIAKELSAILDIPLKNDRLRESVPEFPKTNELQIEIEDSKKCQRYIGALMRCVKVAQSPQWLREALESVGQRSINNIVDATNYVMLNIGQPLHAFDAKKLSERNGKYAIKVRNAKKDEKIITLTGEEYILPESILLITDANSDNPIGIAGIKGGKAAEITNDTTDIIVESANFDGTTIRRGAQALKLSTEASLRFQNRPSPELCAYALLDVLAIIKKIAGGEVAGIVDEYPTPAEKNRDVSASLGKINGVLGSNFSREEVANVFNRLGFEIKINGDIFTVTPPFERTDISIPEDLAEEVGRIIGYDKIIPTELPPLAEKPNQARYRGIEKIKDFLVERGFTEISTQSFAKKGDIELANPLDKTKPALRKSLDENIQDALERAKNYAPLVLAPNQKIKLFEIGTVFQKDGERLEIKTSEPISDLSAIQDDENYIPKKYTLGAFKPFSIYPLIVRDIALWVPSGINEGFPKPIIQENAGELLIRLDQFDKFEKKGKTSLAFRLVFQSFDRTLTDDEVNEIMKKISAALSEKGYEVR